MSDLTMEISMNGGAVLLKAIVVAMTFNGHIDNGGEITFIPDSLTVEVPEFSAEKIAADADALKDGMEVRINGLAVGCLERTAADKINVGPCALTAATIDVDFVISLPAWALRSEGEQRARCFALANNVPIEHDDRGRVMTEAERKDEYAAACGIFEQ